MTPMEVQTLIAAIGGLGLLFTALATLITTRATKTKVDVVETNTNATNSALSTKVDMLHAALLLKAETSPAAPPQAAPPAPPTLPGPPAAH
jgi:hypothetical protein